MSLGCDEKKMSVSVSIFVAGMCKIIIKKNIIKVTRGQNIRTYRSLVHKPKYPVSV